MRLTDFADPNAYNLSAEDDDDFRARHQHGRPNGATDEVPLSPRRNRTLPPIIPTNFLDKLWARIEDERVGNDLGGGHRRIDHLARQ